jgi:VIT1/CCC1 family predicted Fe2+/Mn2+ transporter
VLLGLISARAGGSSPKKAVLRLVFWGTITMGATILIGSLFDVGMV